MIIVKPGYEILTNISDNGIDELKLIEKIGRVCYKSEDKISEDGESAKKFVKMLIDHKHYAMIEHSSLSVKFTVDRGVTHEMVRHRIASFAQESTRYCNYSLGKFNDNITVVIPTEFLSSEYDNIFESYNIPREGQYTLKDCNKNFIGALRDLRDGLELDHAVEIYFAWLYSMLTAEDYYMTMIDSGAKPQLARSVLPNSTKADITITANYREWRQIFTLRCAPDAHPDIRYIMCKLLEELHTKLPVIFDDIYDNMIVK